MRLPLLLIAFIALFLPTAGAEDATVTLPLSRWDALVSQADATDPTPIAPVSVLHLSRVVQGRFSRGVFSGTIKIKIFVPEGHETERVPILPAGTSLGEVLLDGARSSLLLSGAWYTVGVTRPGYHEIDLQFLSGREDDRFRRELALNLPPAGPTSLDIWLPETGVEASLTRGALVSTVEEAGGTRIRGNLDGTGALELRWKRLSADAAAAPQRADAALDAVFTLHEALVQGIVNVSWRLREGEADRFDLSLPPELEVLDVTGDAVLQWYTSASDAGEGRLTVLTRYVVTDAASVAVHFQFPMDLEKDLDLRLPLPVLAEGATLRGELGVQGPAGLAVEVANASAVRALDARDTPTSLLDLAASPLLLAFAFEASPTVSLHVTRQAEIELTSTIIDDVQASTLLLEDGTEIGKLRLRLRNNTRQYLAVTLPPETVLTHALIDGAPVRPAVATGKDGVESLLFPLRQSERMQPGVSRTHLVRDGETLSGIALLYDPSPGFWRDILSANTLSSPDDLEPGQTLIIPAPSGAASPESSFVIELAYTRSTARLGWLGAADLALPSMDVDALAITWHVYLPEGLLPVRFDANLSLMSQIRYDPIRRFFSFLDDALGGGRVWAGEDAYQNILSQRRGLYKVEMQSKGGVQNALSSFPYTGTRYRFERLLPGTEAGHLSVWFIDRDGVPLVRWGALFAAFALTLGLCRRNRGRAATLLGFAVLLLVAHVVLGVHRRILWGVDLALCWDLVQTRLRAPLASWAETPPNLRAALRGLGWRHALSLGVLAFAAMILAAFPMLLSSLALVALLSARRTGGASRLNTGVGVALLALVLMGAPARAGEEVDAADVAADQAFESIMDMNSLGYAEGGEWSRKAGVVSSPAEAVNLPAATVPAPAPMKQPEGAELAPADGEVVVPLIQYQLLLDRIQAAATAPAAAPPVVLGSSIYSGEARGNVLSLRLKLGVTLSGEGRWKMVPVIGEEVVIVAATAGNTPIALSTRDGYHVWVTDRSGEVELTVDLLVPPKGPRGSLEYDFLAARTPVTRFSATFPVAGLQPRLRGAVSSELSSTASSTSLSAVLTSTSRVHLVGYRDLGGEDSRAARVYAESLNLLSLGDHNLELFSVFRYNILYAGAREFNVFIPSGWTLVSADAEGAFRHTLEPVEGGQLLRGETAFPIRNSFELSLRLQRDMPESGKPFDVELPRGQGLERQYGWLAVEVNGNRLLESADHGSALPVDGRQLPWMIVESAVSPILEAWRVLDPATHIQLVATALPEKEPASGSIDRVSATSVISEEGDMLTELRITLRNRLRHALSLTLPENSKVRTAFLDDEAVRPSQGADGRLMFPLKRSAGSDRLEPFTLTVVFETDVQPPGWFGRSALTLPGLDLPSASLRWTVYVPSASVWSALEGDVSPQTLAGQGQWYVPPAVAAAGVAGPLGAPAALETGDLPVRIDIPTQGRALTWTRYWAAADQPVVVTTWHLRGWLRGPLVLLGLGALAGLVRAAWASRWRGPRLLVAFAAGLSLVVALNALAGALPVVAGLGLGIGAALLARPGLGMLPGWLRGTLAPPPEASPSAWSQRGILPNLILLGALLGGSGVLLLTALRLLWVLAHPLSG